MAGVRHQMTVDARYLASSLGAGRLQVGMFPLGGLGGVSGIFACPNPIDLWVVTAWYREETPRAWACPILSALRQAENVPNRRLEDQLHRARRKMQHDL